MTPSSEALPADWEQFVAVRDAPAFQRLYERYYHYFALVGARRGATTEATRDAVNDLFTYLWEDHARLGRISSPHNYLITVFLQKLRRTPATVSADEATLEALALPFSEPSVEAAYIQDQNQQKLRALLAGFVARLPTRQREILYQKFYLGLSNAEIAAAGTVSVSTVYNTLHQALEKLRATLGDDVLQLLGVGILLAALLGQL